MTNRTPGEITPVDLTGRSAPAYLMEDMADIGITALRDREHGMPCLVATNGVCRPLISVARTRFQCPDGQVKLSAEIRGSTLHMGIAMADGVTPLGCPILKPHQLRPDEREALLRAPIGYRALACVISARTAQPRVDDARELRVYGVHLSEGETQLDIGTDLASRLVGAMRWALNTDVERVRDWLPNGG